MKNIKYFLILLVFTLSYFSSCKHVHVDTKPINDDCPEMYEARTLPYINPYMGTLNNGSAIPPDYIFPEKYCYWSPCINPNNDYEICYCRRDNAIQSSNNMELCTYNFCTGISKTIASGVNTWIDWSSKDWIIFTGSDANQWKIKSNGDSLIQLTTNGGNYTARWSPDGNYYIWNGYKLANEEGQFIKDLSQGFYTYVWKDNETIIGGTESSDSKWYEIFEYNILSNSASSLIKMPMAGGSFVFHLTKNKLYFGIGNPANDGQTFYYTLDLITKDTFRLHNTPLCFPQAIGKSPSNKLLLRQGLLDTMTGNPLYLNFRSHIAIMDLDGKNERQVILPE